MSINGDFVIRTFLFNTFDISDVWKTLEQVHFPIKYYKYNTLCLSVSS